MIGKFAANVITVIAGTSIAQLIQISISPVLSRIYTVDEFGIFGVFSSIVAIVSIVSTGRYESAILLPKDDDDAYAILVLSLGLSSVVSTFALLVVMLIGGPNWLYFVPPAIILSAWLSGLSYWRNRLQQYRRISSSRVLSSSSNALVCIALGLLGGGWGLIGGQLAGNVVAAGTLGWRLPPWKKLNIAGVATRYARFPKVLVVAHLINVVSQRLPFLLLAPLFGLTTAGLYVLTYRVINLPSQTVSGAMGEVFRRRASEEYRDFGNCRSTYLSTLKWLMVLAVPGFVCFFAIAPFMFHLVFGSEWEAAGQMARLLTPMIAFQFVSSPLSEMFVIAERQGLDMAWQVALLFVTLSSFLIGYLTQDQTLTIWLFSGSYTAMYIINIAMTYRFSCGNISQTLRQ